MKNETTIKDSSLISVYIVGVIVFAMSAVFVWGLGPFAKIEANEIRSKANEENIKTMGPQLLEISRSLYRIEGSLGTKK